MAPVIEIEFAKTPKAGYPDYWVKKVQKSALIVNKILSDDSFLEFLAQHSSFDDGAGKQIPASDVVTALRALKKKPVKVTIAFHVNHLTRAIAYEEGDMISINMAKESYGAGDWPNIMHETLHALKFHHNGNRARGNENTVPWRVPEIAECCWIGTAEILKEHIEIRK